MEDRNIVDISKQVTSEMENLRMINWRKIFWWLFCWRPWTKYEGARSLLDIVKMIKIINQNQINLLKQMNAIVKEVNNLTLDIQGNKMVDLSQKEEKKWDHKDDPYK